MKEWQCGIKSPDQKWKNTPKDKQRDKLMSKPSRKGEKTASKQRIRKTTSRLHKESKVGQYVEANSSSAVVCVV